MSMFKNYLRVAFRTLQKEKGYAFLNVAGLALGLACCALIALYVQDERAYDRHHERADRIYRVTLLTAEGRHWAPVGPPLGPALEAFLPEVEAVTRFFATGNAQTVVVDDERFEAGGGVYADSTLFSVFTHPLLDGNSGRALAQPNTIVLTETMAQRLFGASDPMGQTVGWPGSDDLTVTGVMADLPPTTHLPFDYAVSMQTFYNQQGDWLDEARTWAGFYTYVLLHPDAHLETVAAKLPGFVDTFYAPDHEVAPSTQDALKLQPLTDIHLHSKLEKEYAPNGDALYVAVFLLVAVFVLVLAVVNFVNLTTARSGTRLREVGVRKSLGSTRGQLAGQFLTDSLLASGAAVVAAYLLIVLALPLLNGLTGKSFVLSDVQRPGTLGGLVALALLTGISSGLYPAWHLSGFRPARALRGGASGGQRAGLRRGLVVFQFAISVFMLVGTATVFQQLQHVRHKALGFDKERVAAVRLSGPAAYLARQDLDGFRQRLEESTTIERVSLAADAPGTRYSVEGVRLEQTPDEETYVRIAWGVDHGYAETLGLSFVAGRDFAHEAPADTAAWLINEAAMRELGLDAPIGEMLTWDNRYRAPIVGVVKDFHFASLHGPIEPLVVPLRPGVGNTLLVRVRDDIPTALAHVRAQLDALLPDTPFHYVFLDDTFDQLYRQEERLSRVFGLFAGLAIVIACLGLFGLAAYTAERRRKEVGIRKVLGASAASVVALLSREFVRLVALAFVVATPLAWWVMRHWLDGFAYRIDLGPGLFAFAGVLTLGIALLTVSYHALRAATADPVKSLRYE